MFLFGKNKGEKTKEQLFKLLSDGLSKKPGCT